MLDFRSNKREWYLVFFIVHDFILIWRSCCARIKGENDSREKLSGYDFYMHVCTLLKEQSQKNLIFDVMRLFLFLLIK